MSRYAMCPNCGRRLRRAKDIGGYWDGETYYCENCASATDDYDEGDDEDESLSVYDAADIWLSNGMDEDYTFGYSEEELRDALR